MIGDLQNERLRDFYGCVCVLNILSVSYEDMLMTSNCFYHYFIDTPTCSPTERRFPALIFFMAISETTPLFVLMQVIRSILKIELFIREIRQRIIQKHYSYCPFLDNQSIIPYLDLLWNGNSIKRNRKHAKSITATLPTKDILQGLSKDIPFSEELVYLKWYMMNEPFNHKVEQN